MPNELVDDANDDRSFRLAKSCGKVDYLFSRESEPDSEAASNGPAFVNAGSGGGKIIVLNA